MKKTILLATALVCCTAAQTSFDQDRIQPFRDNPRYWQYRGKPILLAGGSVDDNLFQIPFLKEHLDTLAAVGGNYIRNTMSSRPDKGWEVYRFKQLQNGKYDLDQWNDEYWRRFSNLLQWTHERGIIVQIEVWDRFDYSQKYWLSCPWNPANNINYTFEETGLAPEYPEHPWRDLQPFFHSIPGMAEYRPQYDVFRNYQEKFIDMMLSYTLNYDNVLYCMSNETTTHEKWGQYWMQYIRDRAAAKGVGVCVTDMFDDFWKAEESTRVRLVFDHPEIYDFIDISQVNSRNFGQTHWDRMSWLVSLADAHPRPCNNTKIYGSGFTSFGSGSPADGVDRFWRNLIGGCASARFHRPTSGNGLNDLAQASLKSLRMMETPVKMWETEVHQELLRDREDDEAYVRALPGKKYVLFFPNGGEVGLDLSGYAKPFELKWIDILHAEWLKGETVTGGTVLPLTVPGEGQWLAILVANE